MDLTTLARVRSLRGIPDSDTASNGIIETLITTVSARAVSYMGRFVESDTYTEERELRRGNKVVVLRAYPVSSVVSVTLDDEALESGAGYRVQMSHGVLRILQWTPGRPGVLTVEYVGGMGADTAAFVAAWPAISGALDSQVVYEFNRRQTPGGHVETRDGSATFATPELNWVEGVREVLDMYAIGGRLSS